MNENVIFKLKGLDCPHCASKIEKDSSSLSDVSEACVNLMKQELTIKFKNGVSKEKLEDDIKSIVNKYEPDVIVCQMDKYSFHDSYKSGEEQEIKMKLILYGLGIILFIAAYSIKVDATVKNIIFLASYLIFGFDVLKCAIKNIFKGQVFDENFLMSVSTIGAIIIGEMPEAVFVMFFYQVGEFFQDMAVEKSRRSIKELMDIKPEVANVEETDGRIIEKTPENVGIGDIVVVRAGERIPLDGIIVEGKTQLDTSALTGESIPRTVGVDEEVLSGSINLTGLLKVRVTKEFGESTVVKMLELVENASAKKSRTEQFITKFARIYTPIVVLGALALALIPPIFTSEADIWMWVGRALIFLVISCPCALVLSVPLGFFSGIGEASKRGVLIKGSNYMQVLSEISTVVFDKTGTLTKGVFEVSEIDVDNGFSEEEVIRFAAYAEKMSNHPIAKSILKYYEDKNDLVDESKVKDYVEISGLGVCANIEGKNIFVGNGRLMDNENIKYSPFSGIGSIVYVAVNGIYAGSVVVSDKVKDDSGMAIKNLKQLGVNNVVMLTGDNIIVAEKISKELGIDNFFAELLPGQKVEKLEMIFNNSKGKTAFVGDGINDAPVLARADVGIAMGGIGSDAAIEAADVVIMNDELSKIADGIIISKNTNRIVKQNIVFALGVKVLVLVLGAMGIATMWMAVFADVGVALIAILNSMRKKIN